MSIRLLVAAIALLLAGCGDKSDDGAGSEGGPELDGRTFIATSIEDRGATRILAAGTELRLSFDDGKLGINAGCNHMAGDYRLDGAALTVGAISTTDMGCEPKLMAQDLWVSDVFAEPLTVSLTRSTLRLTGDDVEMELTDREVASPDAELVGPTWLLDVLIAEDAVSSVPAGVVASLLIEDGKAHIDTGCNAVTADVAVDDTTMTFTNPTTTDVHCDGPDSRVAKLVTDVLLNGPVTWVVEEKSLTVMRGEQGLAFRVA